MRTNCKARAIPYRTRKGFWKPTPSRTALPICAGTPTTASPAQTFKDPVFKPCFPDGRGFVPHYLYDGRISQDNKAWAKTIPMPEDSDASRHCAYLVVDGVNPGLTDLFTRQARKTMQEPQKSSVLQKLRQEPPARKPAAPKKREPER